MELWKPVKDYEGYYAVSNLGRVRSLKRTTTKGRIIKPMFRSRYMYVDLSKEGYRRSYSLGRVVAIAHISNPHSKLYVNHKDGNPKNNKSSNLEWVTASENMQHAFDNGLKHPTRGELNWAHKLREGQVRDIRLLATMPDKIRPSHAKIAKTYGVSRQAISDIINRKKWKHI